MPSKEQQIQILKEQLQSTDYIAIKSYEGLDCSKYGDWKAMRQELRDEIERLQNMTDEEYEQEIAKGENGDNL